MTKLCYAGLHSLRKKNATRADGSCRECYLEYTRNYAKKKRLALRQAVNKTKLERGCEKCGYDEHPQALQFDHKVPVRNGKAKDRGRGNVVKCMADLRRVLLGPNIQIICANCHCIKTYENGDYR